MMFATTTNTQQKLTLTRAVQNEDLIKEGIVCEGTTLNDIPGFGCKCKPESNTFHEHDGKYCYSSSQILTVEGKFFFFLFVSLFFY